MKNFKKVSLFMLCLFISVAANAQSAQSQLNSFLMSFRNMTASFTQEVKGKDGAIVQKSSGKLALQRPGKFRWETLKPSHEVIIANGDKVWVYNIALQQATEQNISKHSASPATFLTMSVIDLHSQFKVKRLPLFGPGIWFKLQPRRSSPMFDWIRLHFLKNKLVDMDVVDKLGQMTEFNFTDVKTNTSLPDGLFVFKPPAGVDVIKNIM